VQPLNSDGDFNQLADSDAFQWNKLSKCDTKIKVSKIPTHNIFKKIRTEISIEQGMEKINTTE